MNREFKYIKSKANAGPGGIHCPCCRKGSKKQARIFYNKSVRRYARSIIRKELSSID